MVLFFIAVTNQVGNGNNTLFWTDPWLHECFISELVPTVVACVRPQSKTKRTVAEALGNNAWVSDIQGGLSMIGLSEYLHLWDGLREVALSQDDDQHIWRFDASRTYSAKSTYRAFFYGSVTFEPWRCLWKSWAPRKYKFFIWLSHQKPTMLDGGSAYSSRFTTSSEMSFM